MSSESYKRFNIAAISTVLAVLILAGLAALAIKTGAESQARFNEVNIACIEEGGTMVRPGADGVPLCLRTFPNEG